MTEAEGLADKLAAEGDRLCQYWKDLKAADWAIEIYTEGAIWTVRSIVAHLVTSERAFVRLFDGIRNGGSGVSEDFVIDRYNASQQAKMREVDPEELIRQYSAARLAMVALVRGLTDFELDRNGRHPFLGLTSLREMIKMIYIHNQAHYRDVRRSLKG